MKKLLILLFSILIASCIDTDIDTDTTILEDYSKLDFSSDAFCEESPKVEVRDGLFYLLNQQEPYSGENICVYESNGQYYLQGVIKKGLRYGKETRWHENGQKWEEGNYKDGKRDGKWTYENENGKTYSRLAGIAADSITGSATIDDYYIVAYFHEEHNYKDGKKDGKSTMWHANGQKKYEGNYKDGWQDGKWTGWYENGQIRWEINYKDGGQEDGKWTGWYEDGQKWFEMNYKDGELDGKWTEWYENGQISMEVNAKDGEGDGKMTAWYENGQILMEINYKDGKLDGKLTAWYENGQIEAEAIYKDGECISGDCDFKGW